MARTSLCARALGLVVGLTATGAASADEPGRPMESAPPDGPTRDVWYGAPMLAVDAASIGLFVGGAALAVQSICILDCTANQQHEANAGAAMFLLGGAGFVLGAPIAHWSRGRIEPGFTSFMVRLLVPAAVAFSSAGLTSVACDGGPGCGGMSTTVPLALTGLSVAAIVLADDVLGAHKAVPAASGASLRLLPSVTMGRVTTVGVGAAF